MKISTTFDRDCRRFSITPEDHLEDTVLSDMAEMSEKGAKILMTKTNHGDQPSKEYTIEMKVNGK